MVGSVLYFETIAIADLDRAPDLHPSARGRLERLVSNIEGDRDPAPGAGVVTCPHCGETVDLGVREQYYGRQWTLLDDPEPPAGNN